MTLFEPIQPGGLRADGCPNIRVEVTVSATVGTCVKEDCGCLSQAQVVRNAGTLGPFSNPMAQLPAERSRPVGRAVDPRGRRKVVKGAPSSRSPIAPAFVGRPESFGLAQPARDLVLIPVPSQLLTPCFEPTSPLCLGSEQEENMRRAESEYGRPVEPSPHLLHEPLDMELSVFPGEVLINLAFRCSCGSLLT